jgi:hypothetical protein
VCTEHLVQAKHCSKHFKCTQNDLQAKNNSYFLVITDGEIELTKKLNTWSEVTVLHGVAGLEPRQVV